MQVRTTYIPMKSVNKNTSAKKPKIKTKLKLFSMRLNHSWVSWILTLLQLRSIGSILTLLLKTTQQ